MLQVTDSGILRGFSFEKRGKAYRYVEDWLLNATANDEEIEDDYSGKKQYWKKNWKKKKLFF